MAMADTAMEYGTKEMEDGSVQIIIPGNPYTKKNSQQIAYKYGQGGKRIPFIVPSREFRLYEADCRFFLQPLEINKPINVKALFYMRTRRRVDLTNLNEALHDILVDCRVITDDNCKIVVSTDGSRVFYDKENPRTEILITDAE